MNELSGPAALIPLLMLFPLAATIRQSWPGPARCQGRISNMVSGSGWLAPLIFIVPMSIGLMIAGRLSPLPQRSYAMIASDHGPAAGLAAAMAVVIAEFWLALAPAMVVLRFSEPTRRQAMRGLIPLNVVLGLGFLTIILLIWR
jgi:hypothetical protein